VVIVSFLLSEILRNVYKKPLYTSGGETSLMAEIHIENIVVTAKIARSLDLDSLSKVVIHSTYDPEEAPTLIIHFSTPKLAAMLFSTGTVVITGITAMDTIDEVIGLLNDALTTAGVQAYRKPEVTIQTIIASTELENSFDLQAVAESLENTEYDPKRFPGLIYTLDDPPVVLLLFSSGKVVCNGPEVELIEQAFEKIKQEVSLLGKVEKGEKERRK
jgi:transcription initiation factor TFIID TATA-box-binding protein